MIPFPVLGNDIQMNGQLANSAVVRTFIAAESEELALTNQGYHLLDYDCIYSLDNLPA
jgi:hypothetical protein